VKQIRRWIGSHRIAAGRGFPSRTLSRWRHGFKSRWDYDRESAGQRHSLEPAGSLNGGSNAEYPESDRVQRGVPVSAGVRVDAPVALISDDGKLGPTRIGHGGHGDRDGRGARRVRRRGRRRAGSSRAPKRDRPRMPRRSPPCRRWRCPPVRNRSSWRRPTRRENGAMLTVCECEANAFEATVEVEVVVDGFLLVPVRGPSGPSPGRWSTSPRRRRRALRVQPADHGRRSQRLSGPHPGSVARAGSYTSPPTHSLDLM
jgi:hypothetical protein